MLTLQVHKKKITNRQYILINKALKFMLSQDNQPLAKYRMINNKLVVEIMIDNKFVMEVDDHVDRLHEDTKYYVISPKGFEYMRAFQRLESLFE